MPSRDQSNLLTLISNATAVAQNYVSTEYDRQVMRYHLFQLIGIQVTDSVKVEVSLDGESWATLTTMTGLNVLERYHGVLPYIRATRLDVPVNGNDKILFYSYSAREEGYFE